MRGLPERHTDTADDSNHVDPKTIEALLEFYRVENKKNSKTQRLGKYEKDKEKSRTLLINTKNTIRRDMFLRTT